MVDGCLIKATPCHKYRSRAIYLAILECFVFDFVIKGMKKFAGRQADVRGSSRYGNVCCRTGAAMAASTPARGRQDAPCPFRPHGAAGSDHRWCLAGSIGCSPKWSSRSAMSNGRRTVCSGMLSTWANARTSRPSRCGVTGLVRKHDLRVIIT